MDLEATVRALAPKVLGYCIIRTGEPSLAEEIAQESLAALVQRCRRHGPPRSADAFVFAVARRRAARAVLRRRLLLPLEHLISRRDGRPDPEAGLAQSEERHRLVAALARLGRRDRELMLLISVAELPIRDAAQLLGISVSAVKMRTLRAKRRLRALLAMDHSDDLEVRLRQAARPDAAAVDRVARAALASRPARRVLPWTIPLAASLLMLASFAIWRPAQKVTKAIEVSVESNGDAVSLRAPNGTTWLVAGRVMRDYLPAGTCVVIAGGLQ